MRTKSVLLPRWRLAGPSAPRVLSRGSHPSQGPEFTAVGQAEVSWWPAGKASVGRRRLASAFLTASPQDWPLLLLTCSAVQRHLQQSQEIRLGSRWAPSPQLTAALARCCTGSLHTPLPLGGNGTRAAGGGAPGCWAPAGKQLLFWMTSAWKSALRMVSSQRKGKP